MLFTSSLLSTGWIKTRPAQKLHVRVKLTRNPYSYVSRDRPRLKWATRKHEFAGTRIREPVQCRTRTRVCVCFVSRSLLTQGCATARLWQKTKTALKVLFGALGRFFSGPSVSTLFCGGLSSATTVVLTSIHRFCWRVVSSFRRLVAATETN